MLESIIGVNLVVNPLTLEALQELNVFSHDVEIQEVRVSKRFDKLSGYVRPFVLVIHCTRRCDFITSFRFQARRQERPL